MSPNRVPPALLPSPHLSPSHSLLRVCWNPPPPRTTPIDALRVSKVVAELEDARREIAELRELQGSVAEDDNDGTQSDAERLATAQARA